MRGPFSTPITPLPGSLFHADPHYNHDHDATHHWLADRLGWDWSPALHDPEAVDIDHASAPVRWEEHVVNRLQRQVRTGEPDEFGQVQEEFGADLSAVLDELRVLYGRIA